MGGEADRVEMLHGGLPWKLTRSLKDIQKEQLSSGGNVGQGQENKKPVRPPGAESGIARTNNSNLN